MIDQQNTYQMSLLKRWPKGWCQGARGGVGQLAVTTSAEHVRVAFPADLPIRWSLL